jgi:hypothetical protein
MTTTTTNPDPDLPRGRAVIAARLLRLEAEVVSLRLRVGSLERWEPRLVFAVALALLLAFTAVFCAKGIPAQ